MFVSMVEQREENEKKKKKGSLNIEGKKDALKIIQIPIQVTYQGIVARPMDFLFVLFAQNLSFDMDFPTFKVHDLVLGAIRGANKNLEHLSK